MQPFYTSASVCGDKINLRYIDENGDDRITEIEDFGPTLFTKTDSPTGYQDIYGKHCLPKKFDSIKDARGYYKERKEMGIEVLGMDDYILQYLSDNFNHDMKLDMRVINICNIDIETKSDIMPEAENPIWEIDQIGIRDRRNDLYYSFSLYDWSPDNCHERVKDISKRVVHQKFDNERDLLKAFIVWWKQNTPHIVTGWNVAGFDIPYICARLEYLWSDRTYKRLSPYGRVYKRTFTNDFGNEQIGFNIDGVEVLDYLQLYKKFVLDPRPNYKLGTIGEIETGKSKIEYDGKLKDLSAENPQKYVDYNLIDTRLVEQIDDKRDLINLATFVAYHAKVPLQAVFSPVKVWDATIFNALKVEKKVVPMMRVQTKHKFEGGFVKEPQLKLNGWTMSFDFESLYPKCIMQCNISPETLMHYDEDAPPDADWFNKKATPLFKEYACAPNGAYYRKDKVGVVAQEIEKVFNDRKASKKKAGQYKQQAKECDDPVEKERLTVLAGAFKTREQALKILINSLYGALGNEYFRLYDWRNAEAVTSFGRIAIQWGERKVNEWLSGLLGTDDDYVLAIDTDSLYIDFQPLIDAKKKTDDDWNTTTDWLDKLAERVIQPKTKDWYNELAEYMNSYAQQMSFDREAISPKSFWVAKKMYAMIIMDMEGYRYKPEEADLKHMGLETKRSSTPELVREGLKTCLQRILVDGEESLQQHVNEFRDKYWDASIYDICKVSRANNLPKYQDYKGRPIKGCPGHLKGAMLYNRLAEEKGFDAIIQGDKIAYIELKQPNSFDKMDATALAWSSGSMLPDPLREPADRYVDRDTMFEKNFMMPVNKWCNIVGMNAESVDTLDEFFE